jgi:uncharacterized membrane protein
MAGGSAAPSGADAKRRIHAEHRWPAVVALLIALALYVTLPSDFLLPLRIGVAAVGLLTLIPLTVFNPRRLSRESRWSRILSLGQSVLLLIANQIALGGLIHELVTVKSSSAGPSLLLSALQVWVTNVIVYGLVFWELDRGGPVSRRIKPRTELPHADFRFPQDEDEDAVDEVASGSSSKSDWVAGYVDYAYFSLTNSMAFSPTDTMPLRTRGKVLMGLESFAAFVILALVIARAVSLLG